MRYRNPILFADWSDPDAIRVGDDFYLTASSFNRVPGLPVLHSLDLVHWRVIGHALDRLEPEEFFRTPRLGCGVWAPALRYHGGLFWIVYPDPDHGLFVVTATDPAGPWSAPRPLKMGPGLIDPCPLWTEDGAAYLVHGWARSRVGFNNRLTLHRMAPDASGLLDGGRTVIDGDAVPGCHTLEGPKLYRKHGWYWIFAPAGGVTGGWQYAFRSRDPFGPYEHRIVLAQGGTPVNGPHQGAWVDTPQGTDWFLHFQDRGPYGRVVHLQPMAWDGDGWPLIGSPPGLPVREHAVPLPAAPAGPPPADDDFTGSSLGPQWTFPANPRFGWYELRPGVGLRLPCVPGGDDLRRVPNVLGQRLPGESFRAGTTMRLRDSEPGARAGLAVIGRTYGWIGLEHTESGVRLVCRTTGERDAVVPVPVEVPEVHLEVRVEPGAVCHFRCTALGSDPEPFPATAGQWIGATLGVFATGPTGHADFNAFTAGG